MTSGTAPQPGRLTATSADLPPAVAAALAAPTPGEPGWVDADDTHWATVTWGNPADPPVLLVHGVTSNAGIWWRTAPAIAAAGWHVIAVDMPGHGQTQAWRGRHRFAETAADIVGFIRAAGLDMPNLAVVGHSWGAIVTAHLPRAGFRPRVLVLIDPGAMTVAQLETSIEDPTERPYSTIAEAAAAIRKANPTWSDGDISAKAESLTQFNEDAVRAVLLQNGDWDSGMAALRDPRTAGIPTWLIRGEQSTGSLIPETSVPALVAQLGLEHVITIAGGPHSPQRTHPEATVLALLRALA